MQRGYTGCTGAARRRAQGVIGVTFGVYWEMPRGEGDAPRDPGGLTRELHWGHIGGLGGGGQSGGLSGGP